MAPQYRNSIMANNISSWRHQQRGISQHENISSAGSINNVKRRLRAGVARMGT